MLPDNRIRFDPTPIDFAGTVGVTGQSHDIYPAPGSQARYDWQRSYLLGLLSHQASYAPPTQYRDGTVWFNLSTQTFLVWVPDNHGGAWQPLSAAIALHAGIDSASTLTLQGWFDIINPVVNGVLPILTFSGVSNQNAVASITVPASLQQYVDGLRMRPFVWVNGLLQDPRSCQLQGSTTIVFSGLTLSLNDRFTVELKNIPEPFFFVPDVVVP